MSQVPKPRSDKIAPFARLVRCSPAVALLLLTGCLNERGPLEHDPLAGGPPIPTRMPASASSSGVGALASREVPPPPSPYAPSSPAALASVDPQGQNAWSSPKAGPGATLGPPVGPLGPGTVSNAAPPPGAPPAPITLTGGAAQPASSFPPVAAAPALPGSLQEANYERLQVMLLERNVTWQRLDMVGDKGEWQFMCAIPNPANRAMRRNYVARAVGPYGLAAIRAAITEIDLASGAATPRPVVPAAGGMPVAPPPAAAVPPAAPAPKTAGFIPSPAS